MMQKLHLPKEEVARRGKELYEVHVRSQVEAENVGQVVAIDVESGEFAIGENSLNASDILLERLPDAQIWFVRVGHRAVHRIGYAGSMIVS
jgi:hypothetical protein